MPTAGGSGNLLASSLLSASKSPSIPLFQSLSIFSPGAGIVVILSAAKGLGTRTPPREYTRSFAALRMTLTVRLVPRRRRRISRQSLSKGEPRQGRSEIYSELPHRDTSTRGRKKRGEPNGFPPFSQTALRLLRVQPRDRSHCSPTTGSSASAWRGTGPMPSPARGRGSRASQSVTSAATRPEPAAEYSSASHSKCASASASG